MFKRGVGRERQGLQAVCVCVCVCVCVKKFQGKKAQTIDAIKTQMGYRRKVLEQKLVDRKLWNFSEGGVQFSPAQMTQRLRFIIRQPLAKGKE